MRSIFLRTGSLPEGAGGSFETGTIRAFEHSCLIGVNPCPAQTGVEFMGFQVSGGKFAKEALGQG